jgi:thioredoxin-like negative regulator of GroEL
MNYSAEERRARDGSAPDVPNSLLTPDDQHNSAKRAEGYSRETVLVSCLGLLVLLLGLTAFAARMYHKKVHVLADEWYARGEAAFHAGHTLEAAKDYRNALVYSADNSVFQFHLAQALIAANQRDTDEQAQSYLLSLLEDSPASGQINLALAHVVARGRNASVQDVLRYYYGAIYGVWEGNPIVERWDARRELCEYLLARGMIAQAQPEAIALAHDVPLRDLGRQKEAAALLMRVGLWDRAFAEYHAILSSHRSDRDALAGEGLSAFELGQYARAVEDLEAVPPSGRAQPDISSALALAREVQAVSPYLNGLPPRERARRTALDFARAKALAQNCSQRNAAPGNANAANSSSTNSASAISNLQKLGASLGQNSRVWRELNFLRDPSQIDAAMNWVFQVENAAAQACGQPQDLMDRALLLIAKSRPGSGA